MKKDFAVKFVPWIVIASMLVLLIPGIVTRINSESKNDNIVISALYNDLYNKVSPKKLDDFLDRSKKCGIDTISIMEDDLNSLVSRGDVTSIKYNGLRLKYDEESVIIADEIESKCPNISYDSHVIIVKNDKIKSRLDYAIPKKYGSETYSCIKNVDGKDIYVFYNGRRALWDFSLGYDEETIKSLANKGFGISLVYKVRNYEKQDYLKDIERLVKEYNVEYFNLKLDGDVYGSKVLKKENYEVVSRIITDNNLTLVVTENLDQLSNQKFLGYDKIFNDVMSKNGPRKVIRAYETYDDSQAVGTDYSYRVSQYFNSTIDRNIRFIVLTQIVLSGVSYDECADYTLNVADVYCQKVQKEGFRVGSDTTPYNYKIIKSLNYCACAVLMVMFALIILQKIFGLNNFYVAMSAYIIAALAIVATFILPDSLVNLYPTAYSAIMSCFVMTLILSFVKEYTNKMSFPVFVASVFGITVGSLLLCSVGLGTMLSGVNYYINNDIFRGIKLSLLVPVGFTMVAYYIVFMKTQETNIFKRASKILSSVIKVYWVLIAGFIGAIGIYYIIRSGNVNSISSIEHWLRNTVTEIFPARPRTKEFLIGYPALLLFLYYSKYYDIKLVNWVIAVGASILTASVTNSFCHVFTDYLTIVSRTLNGLIMGVIVSAVVYFINIGIVRAVKEVKKRI